MGKKMTATQQLRYLGVGESCTFPAEQVRSIRSMASENGFLWDKQFATSLDREQRVVTVTRTK